MTRFATGLAARGISVVTFNFLYTEQGADEAFVQAQSAEEASDLLSAESLYRLVMNLDPNDPEEGGSNFQSRGHLHDITLLLPWAS